MFEYRPPQHHENNSELLRPQAPVRIEVIDSVVSQRSLADIFRERRGVPAPRSEKPQAERRPEKTKEELAEIRRQMMKPKTSTLSSQSSGTQVIEEPHQPRGKKGELMSRLARGEKASVSKEDMLKLTSKNYENLPEVRKKREAERKKEEQRDRMRQVKELERQRRALSRGGK